MGGCRAPPPSLSISPLSLPLLFLLLLLQGGKTMASPLPRRASSWSVLLTSRSGVLGLSTNDVRMAQKLGLNAAGPVSHRPGSSVLDLGG